MTSILVTADWQLDDNPVNAYRHQFQKQLRAIVKKHDVKLLLLLGDLTEEKDRHGAWLVNRIVDHLDRLRRLCRIIIVRGNHDYVDAGSPFYEFLRHIEGIRWVNEPTEVQLDELGKVMLLPHTSDYKRDWHGLKKTYDWVFTHNTFQGAHAGQGFMLRGIPTDIFGHASVISGDIHIPQTIAPHVTYVGAPYLCDFGDRYEPRVLLVHDAHPPTKGFTSIPVRGPQKRLVKIGCLGDLKVGSADIRYVNPGDILKVRMLITAEQRAEWPELKAKIRAWGEANGYLIHIVQPVMLDSIRSAGRKRARKQQSDGALLREFARNNSLDAMTLKVGLMIARKV